MEKTNASREKQGRGANWSTEEKSMAAGLIVQNYDKLYGKLEGANQGKRDKMTEWEGIAESVNASSKSSKHTVKQIQKMFSNLKSRALQKNGSNKKTGAGPHSKLTTPEEIVFAKVKSKPQTKGIVGGLDSEDTLNNDSDADSDASSFTEPQFEDARKNIPTSTTTLTTSTTTLTTSTTTLTTSTTTLTTATAPTMTNPAGLPIASASGDNTKGCKRKTRRRREDEEDLYALEAKRLKVEIERQEAELELAKARIKQDEELFRIRKQLLEVHLKRAIDENLFNIEL